MQDSAKGVVLNMSKTEDELTEILAMVKYSINYGDTHGGCPPAVESVARHGISEAITALLARERRIALEAKIEMINKYFEPYIKNGERASDMFDILMIQQERVELQSQLDELKKGDV